MLPAAGADSEGWAWLQTTPARLASHTETPARQAGPPLIKRGKAYGQAHSAVRGHSATCGLPLLALEPKVAVCANNNGSLPYPPYQELQHVVPPCTHLSSCGFLYWLGNLFLEISPHAVGVCVCGGDSNESPPDSFDSAGSKIQDLRFPQPKSC